MRPTPRTQPYRAGTPRVFNAALQAMLVGRQPGVVNGGDFARQRAQMQASGGVKAPDGGDMQALALQALQRMRPTVTADVRGTFGGGGMGGEHWDGGQFGPNTLPAAPGGYSGAHAAPEQQMLMELAQQQMQQARGGRGPVATINAPRGGGALHELLAQALQHGRSGY